MTLITSLKLSPSFPQFKCLRLLAGPQTKQAFPCIRAFILAVLSEIFFPHITAMLENTWGCHTWMGGARCRRRAQRPTVRATQSKSETMGLVRGWSVSGESQPRGLLVWSGRDGGGVVNVCFRFRQTWLGIYGHDARPR